MGCAFADYDNDGDLDLYLSNYKANVFFKNQGNGVFKKASSSVGRVVENSTMLNFVNSRKVGCLEIGNLNDPEFPI